MDCISNVISDDICCGDYVLWSVIFLEATVVHPIKMPEMMYRSNVVIIVQLRGMVLVIFGFSRCVFVCVLCI